MGYCNTATVSIGIKFPIKKYLQDFFPLEKAKENVYKLFMDSGAIVDNDENGEYTEALRSIVDDLDDTPMPEYKTQLISAIQNSRLQLYKRDLLVPVHKLLNSSSWGAGYGNSGLSMSIDRAKEIIEQDIDEEFKTKYPKYKVVLMISQCGG